MTSDDDAQVERLNGCGALSLCGRVEAMGFTAPTREMRDTKDTQAGAHLLAVWGAEASLVWRVIRTNPLAVTLAVAMVYIAALWLSFGIQNQNPHDFATIGTRFIQKGGAASPIIQQDLASVSPAGYYGFDGQFCYFIAMDPLHAAPYIDDPTLRYERILYPLAARALALGDTALIPYTLPLVNALAMIAGTLAVALWLRRRKITPWIALLFGLFPGLFFAYRHDLTEPLGFALVAWGILALGWTRPRLRFVAASALFALAALTREATLFISVPYILRLAWPEITGRGWAAKRPGLLRAGAVLAGSVGPFLIWKVVLFALFGAVLRDAGPDLPFRAPFSGLFWYWNQITTPRIANQVSFVVIPGIIATIAAILALLKWPAGWKPATVALAFNALYMCVFLAPQSYIDYSSSGRIQSGVVLAAILALPLFDGLWRQSRSWFWAANALWMAPLWYIALQPIAQGYLSFFHHLILG